MPLRTLLLPLATAALLSLSGCLVVEEFDYTITVNKDRTAATAVSVYRNIRGTAGDTVQTNMDWSELVEDWKGQDYVRKRAATGVTITSRSVYERDGELWGRQESKFSSGSPDFASFFARDTVRVAFRSTDIDSIVATNGRVRRQFDSTIVVWTPGEHAYHIAVRIRLPSESVDLLPRFRAYEATLRK